MDRSASKENRWSWLPREMPGVAALVKQRRTELGDAHVNECWQRGVIEHQPDWFYAREGAIAIGTPFATDPVLAELTRHDVTSTQALLVMRERSDGAH